MQLPRFDNLNIIVIGDVMLDRYWHGDTSRISPEAPVPVVRIEDIEEKPGGAANVALNLASLGAHVQLFGQVGDDEAAVTLHQLLAEQKIHCDLERIRGRDTITKLRVISKHQQLIRLDFEKGLSYNASDSLLQRFKNSVDTADAVILSDYAKGTLDDAHAFVHWAWETGTPVIVDPKGRDFHKYRLATVVTPNLKEFEEVAGTVSDDDELMAKAAAMRQQHQWSALLVTRGAKGMSLVQDGHHYQLPTHAKEVFDVTGAGDTVVALLAAGIAAKMSMVEAVEMANIAAGIVVGKLGAASVTPMELQAAVHQQEHPPAAGVVDENTLHQAVGAAKRRGERVVMTNGCFDILHAGHVDYLQKARQLGDRLVVAVNDDDSVGRLKGARRPINTLADRMEVLAALGCVDWVCPFSEDTPERLICAVLPDVLVKGEDYQVHEIAGHGCVQDNGGQVVTLPMRQGKSTSGIIARAKGKASDDE